MGGEPQLADLPYLCRVCVGLYTVSNDSIVNDEFQIGYIA
jgi:hypothetical protein